MLIELFHLSSSFSSFHRHSIFFSLRFYPIFIIILSYFHRHSILFSSSFYPIFISKQTYDLSFLCEINFPVLLMELVKSTVAERLKTVQKVTETEELEDYKQNMQWWEQCKTSSSFKNWFEEKVRH